MTKILFLLKKPKKCLFKKKQKNSWVVFLNKLGFFSRLMSILIINLFI